MVEAIMVLLEPILAGCEHNPANLPPADASRPGVGESHRLGHAILKAARVAGATIPNRP